jgi:hypothetical protein
MIMNLIWSREHVFFFLFLFNSCKFVVFVGLGFQIYIIIRSLELLWYSVEVFIPITASERLYILVKTSLSRAWKQSNFAFKK